MIKNQRLKINSNHNTEILEKATAALEKSKEEKIDLQLPVSLNAKGLALPTSILLVLFFWMRNKKGNLIIPIKEDDERGLEKFVMSLYGYLVIFSVWRHCDIVNHQGISLKTYFRDFTSQMHKYVNSISHDNLPNNELTLSCFDHYANERGLPYWFYDASYDFKSTPLEFDDTTHAILKHLTKIFKSRVLPALRDSTDAITNILWELLKNTDEHARTDGLNQVTLLPSTRGLFMKLHRSSRSNYLTDSENLGLSNYYLHFADSKDMLFLEISVFDSGPGLPKRFLGKNWNEKTSIADEVDAIKKCLIKGQTSITGMRGDKKGYGLDSVLNLLSAKKGFLNIRTGRAWLYRDLIATPYKETTNHEEIQLYDWSTNSNSEFTNFSNVEGTLFTLAIPLT